MTEEIWSTESVNKLLEEWKKGKKPTNTPFYDNDINYKKPNIVWEYTKQEISEIKKCQGDIVYFANTYCQVMTDEGYRKIELRDYQKKILRSFQKNRYNILLAARQIGKTITSSIFLTWFLVFHYDKNVMLVTNKGDTTKEVIYKIKAVFEGLPWFLKPGILKKDIMSLRLDNNCVLIGQNTTKRSGIGFTIHLLFLDEFAHISENIKTEFYNNIYPTLSSSKTSRIIITSTPNGHELFKKIYEGAVSGMNAYTPIRVDWWDVPGRDDVWRQKEIANLGSEEAFNELYACQFLNSSSLLLGASEIQKLDSLSTIYRHQEFFDIDDVGLDYSEMIWHPEAIKNEIWDNKKTNWVISVDLAEGLGKDYSVLNIFVLDKVLTTENKKDMTVWTDAFGLKQVGVFRTNKYDVKDFAKISYHLITDVLGQDNLKLVIEQNTYGELFSTILTTLYDESNRIEDEIFVRYKRANGKYQIGYRYNKENKVYQCEQLKKNLFTGRIQLSESKTIEETKYFSRNGNSYSAQTGNDDLVMSSVTACTIFETNSFIELCDNLWETLDNEITKQIDELLNNEDDESGFIDDGNPLWDAF